MRLGMSNYAVSYSKISYVWKKKKNIQRVTKGQVQRREGQR